MLVTTILMFLNFLGTLYLESIMTQYYAIELLILVGGLIVGVLLVMAEHFNAPNAFRGQAIYFGISTLNVTVLFILTQSFVMFGLLLILNLAGLMRAVAHLDKGKQEFEVAPPMTASPLETYPVHNPGHSQHYSVDPIISATPEIVSTRTSVGKKRGRGRPKGSKNKVRTVKRAPAKRTPAKRGRGRPPKKRGRGRPRKS